MNERELFQELLTEVRDIRKILDTMRSILEDVQTRLAHIETSRIEYPKDVDRI